MATKAQEFRAATERTAAAASHVTETRSSTPRLTHNDAQRAARKSTHAIERVGAHPSRKSTRGGANRAKPDSAQRIAVRVRNSSPEARATRKSGNPI
jgi:hypothetical protein